MSLFYASSDFGDVFVGLHDFDSCDPVAESCDLVVELCDPVVESCDPVVESCDLVVVMLLYDLAVDSHYSFAESCDSAVGSHDPVELHDMAVL